MNKRTTTTTGSRLCCVLAGLVLGLGFSPDAWARSRGEYFWNNDPGLGRGKTLKEEGTDSNGFSTFTLDAGEMNVGLNMLGLRAYEGGRWSHTQYHFVVLPSTPAVSWSGEYFWNEDPGVGKATPLPPTTAEAGGYLSLDIDASALEAGATHVLGLRMNAGGSWSQTQTYVVMVPADPAVAHWSGEYFWDEDPGIGKGTPLTIAPGTDGAVSFELPTAALAPGEHTLGLRTCAGRAWSQTSLSTVFVPYDYHSDVIAAEYFWGDDPGYGKGTPIELTAGAEVSIDNLSIDFPTETAAEYVLNFRARSEYGWSHTVTKVIPHLYVESIELSAEKDWIEPGETLALTATLTPADAFVSALTWSSDNTAVATVDAQGNVTGRGQGTANITATSTDGTNIVGTKAIRVLTAVKSLTIDPAELTLEVSRTARLTATATPADATNAAVTWAIDDATVARIDAEGNVTALKPGTATLTATAADGCGATAECALTVKVLSGDANGSGSLAVNDVVLTARAVVDDVDPKFVVEAVDFNADGLVRVGDLAQTVNAVLEWTAEPTHVIRRAAPLSGALEAAVSNGVMELNVAGITEFSGLQFDLLTPAGLEAEGAKLNAAAGEGHSLAQRRLSAGRSRVIAYGTDNFRSPGEAAFASIRLTAAPTLAAGEYELTLANVYASDREGNLYSLGTLSATIAYSPQSGINAAEAPGLTVRTEGRKVIIESPADTVVTLTDMHGISRRMEIHSGRTEFTLSTPGVYLINGHKIIIR